MSFAFKRENEPVQHRNASFEETADKPSGCTADLNIA